MFLNIDLSKDNASFIKNNPKFFVGFSDITGLHLAFNKYTDLVTFHGVMAGTSYKWDEFTYNSLINALNNKINEADRKMAEIDINKLDQFLDTDLKDGIMDKKLDLIKKVSNEIYNYFGDLA